MFNIQPMVCGAQLAVGELLGGAVIPGKSLCGIFWRWKLKHRYMH